MASRNNPNRHRKTLERRAGHLQNRIDNYRGTSDSYDRAELAATKWALDRITELENERRGEHELLWCLAYSTADRTLVVTDASKRVYDPGRSDVIRWYDAALSKMFVRATFAGVPQHDQPPRTEANQ